MPINAGDSGSKVQSLGGEDPLEKEMATHSSILAWVIPWTEEPGGLQSMGSQESDATYRLNHHHSPSPPPLPRLGLWQLSLPTPSAGPGTEYRPPGLRLDGGLFSALFPHRTREPPPVSAV